MRSNSTPPDAWPTQKFLCPLVFQILANGKAARIWTTNSDYDCHIKGRPDGGEETSRYPLTSKYATASVRVTARLRSFIVRRRSRSSRLYGVLRAISFDSRKQFYRFVAVNLEWSLEEVNVLESTLINSLPPMLPTFSHPLKEPKDFWFNTYWPKLTVGAADVRSCPYERLRRAREQAESGVVGDDDSDGDWDFRACCAGPASILWKESDCNARLDDIIHHGTRIHLQDVLTSKTRTAGILIPHISDMATEH